MVVTEQDEATRRNDDSGGGDNDDDEQKQNLPDQQHATPPPSGSALMSLRVKMLSGSTLSAQVAPTSTVRELKQQLAAESGLEPARQRLIHMGRVLKDDDPLSAYPKIVSGQTLHLVSSRPPSTTTKAVRGATTTEGASAQPSSAAAAPAPNSASPLAWQPHATSSAQHVPGVHVAAARVDLPLDMLSGIASSSSAQQPPNDLNAILGNVLQQLGSSLASAGLFPPPSPSPSPSPQTGSQGVDTAAASSAATPAPNSGATGPAPSATTTDTPPVSTASATPTDGTASVALLNRLRVQTRRLQQLDQALAQLAAELGTECTTLSQTGSSSALVTERLRELQRLSGMLQRKMQQHLDVCTEPLSSDGPHPPAGLGTALRAHSVASALMASVMPGSGGARANVGAPPLGAAHPHQHAHHRHAHHHHAHHHPTHHHIPAGTTLPGSSAVTTTASSTTPTSSSSSSTSIDGVGSSASATSHSPSGSSASQQPRQVHIHAGTVPAGSPFAGFLQQFAAQQQQQRQQQQQAPSTSQQAPHPQAPPSGQQVPLPLQQMMSGMLQRLSQHTQAGGSPLDMAALFNNAQSTAPTNTTTQPAVPPPATLTSPSPASTSSTSTPSALSMSASSTSFGAANSSTTAPSVPAVATDGEPPLVGDLLGALLRLSPLQLSQVLAGDPAAMETVRNLIRPRIEAVLGSPDLGDSPAARLDSAVSAGLESMLPPDGSEVTAAIRPVLHSGAVVMARHVCDPELSGALLAARLQRWGRDLSVGLVDAIVAHSPGGLDDVPTVLRAYFVRLLVPLGEDVSALMSARLTDLILQAATAAKQEQQQQVQQSSEVDTDQQMPLAASVSVGSQSDERSTAGRDSLPGTSADPSTWEETLAVDEARQLGIDPSTPLSSHYRETQPSARPLKRLRSTQLSSLQTVLHDGLSAAIREVQPAAQLEPAVLETIATSLAPAFAEQLRKDLQDRS
mmetsp:Transcript_4757/g.14514  ORF Transcript_4757/g.14514 Transcript_4757/m.14514 type:complete len:965 (-) Transcript_4757:66-2960(-)